MTIKECYEQFGGNYEDTLRRLTSEALVGRFLAKFPEDKSFAALEKSITTENAQDAFTAAHTLKGVALNLGLTSLFEPTDILTEALRHGWANNAQELFAPVSAAYHTTVNTITAWTESAE